jgi:hypothetical protein
MGTRSVVVVVCLAASSFAWAQDGPAFQPVRLLYDAGPDLMYPEHEHELVAPASEFAAGIGYAHISIGGSGSELNDENGLRFEASVSFSPLAKLPQLRVGAAIGTSLVFDDSDLAIISSGGVVVVGHSTVPLFTVEPEVRLSWRQEFSEGKFYVEPGVGLGGMIAHLDIDSDQTAGGESFNETEANWAARAFVNIGFRTGGGFAGVQLSYLRSGDINLADNASGDVDEFYVGLFGALRF